MATMNELLKYALENDMLDVNLISAKVEMQKREKVLSNHPNKVWEGQDGYWYTYINTDNGRKKIKKKTREQVEEIIFAYYDTTMTFKEYFEHWIERQSLCGRSDNTIYRYKADYKRFCEGSEIESLKIDVISEIEIAKFIKSLANKKYTYKAIQGLFGYIKGMFEMAIRERIVQDNPCNYVDLEMYKRNCKEKEYHTDEERTLSDYERQILMDKLIAKEKSRPYYIPQYACRLSMLTGMRVGEIAALQWQDVFWEKKYILIRHSEKQNRLTKEYTIEDTKNHKTRIFPLTEEIESLLKNIWKKESDQGWLTEFVFSNENGRIHKDTISEAMRNYTLYDKRFSSVKSIHANRRTLNSNMRVNGVSGVVTSSLLGNTVHCNDNHYTYNTMDNNSMLEIVKKAGSL